MNEVNFPEDYDDLPEKAPDHVKIGADFDRYAKEKGLGELSEDISPYFKREVSNSAQKAGFRVSPVVAIAAAYKASVDTEYEEVTERFNLEEFVDSEDPAATLRDTYIGLEFDGKNRRSRSVDGRDLAQDLHNELESGMKRDKVAEVYNSLIE
jgi:hypothetical protein